MSQAPATSVKYSDILKLYTENLELAPFIPQDFFYGHDTDKEKVEKIFCNLACKDLSWAIHQLKGFEVWEFGNDLDGCSHWFHSVCKIPNSNLIIDGKGVRTVQDMLKDYPDHSYSVDTDPEPYFLVEDDLEILKAFANQLLSQSYELLTQR